MTREGVRESRLREYSFCRKWPSRETQAHNGVILRLKRGLSQVTKDQAQLTSDPGILTEAPLRHKDSYVPVAPVPEVLHSNGDAPAGEVVLEAVPAAGRGQRSGAPEEGPLGVRNSARIIPPTPQPGSSGPPGTHTMATLLPSMTM